MVQVTGRQGERVCWCVCGEVGVAGVVWVKVMLINEHQNETNRQTDSDTVFGELGEKEKNVNKDKRRGEF